MSMFFSVHTQTCNRVPNTRMHFSGVRDHVHIHRYQTGITNHIGLSSTCNASHINFWSKDVQASTLTLAETYECPPNLVAHGKHAFFEIL